VADGLWLGWWGDADWVVRGVFGLLVGLSVVSWTVILYKALQLARVLRWERAAAQRLQADAWGAAEALVPGTPAQVLLAAALEPGAPHTREALQERLAHRLRAVRTELENGLTVLATTGNAAPFIGLFGTVWGIMHALQALGGAGGNLSMELIAGPVAEALVATAAGLFTAIPAVVGYNALLRWLRHILVCAEGNALCILERLPATAAPVAVAVREPASAVRLGRA
jgi:biopolymer transport protein ExbB